MNCPPLTLLIHPDPELLPRNNCEGWFPDCAALRARWWECEAAAWEDVGQHGTRCTHRSNPQTPDRQSFQESGADIGMHHLFPLRRMSPVPSSITWAMDRVIWASSAQ
uniref:Uncharacterized protein n=1 Tax=Eutreptiella gymnastica TaxID=73025 RepID=A0A6T1YNR4_9EUGL|eukprot:CAMPEP_0174297410 /NCGR_PEP_ID=MMETSP0809-20121228/50918_1 /TAXON_ID=73025 ORGANISM="Eutreptiella gymnastica-like, Strain CCMP1594" /NCGR_SAMPLE_ID=MMETSP0809 /ASSEMBLY_ACC=CAM_ASM_000658 /LENGTH=107 /DNA_ID=CAMNT_0015401185 /DNA_START=877 /DNA_END=1200 /DNA_ORIENTATION=-